jgi:hypothetical protein
VRWVGRIYKVDFYFGLAGCFQMVLSYAAQGGAGRGGAGRGGAGERLSFTVLYEKLWYIVGNIFERFFLNAGSLRSSA